jgi:hypothetical protein
MYTALLEYVTTPGLDGMRFALFLFNFAVLKDPFRNQVLQSDGKTVVPSSFLRQQTWQENFSFLNP